MSMDNEDAQVTIDYAAGVGIFLISVAFVFQFLYGLFIPFQSGSDEVTLAADRISTVLVERVLAADKSGAMNVIDQGKLYYFMGTELNYSDQARYNSNLSKIGLYSDETVFDLNVSVEYADGTPMSKSGLVNPGGPQLPENIDIGQTRRLVLIVNSSSNYNEMAIIKVRVW